MVVLSELIEETRKLLALSQFKEALKLLKPHKSQFKKNVEYLQILGETYLENGKVEKAYSILEDSCSLDPECKYGSEKFFYLGQIVGGFKGIELIDHGIKYLSDHLQNIESEKSVGSAEKAANIKKLNQGLFSEIEIWMTDLCMEPEAESKCDSLISQSLAIDDTNPESWSLLASIRISQQRKKDAEQAVQKSWELFEKIKTDLENSATSNTDKNEDVSSEYIELIQPLLTLARFSIELELYELGSVIASNVRDIDEDNVESYYLEGFAHFLYVKKVQFDRVNSEFNHEAFDDFKISVDDEQFAENLRIARSNVDKIIKLSDYADVDPDILQQSQVIIEELGALSGEGEEGHNNDVNENNWEDEIQSDNE